MISKHQLSIYLLSSPLYNHTAPPLFLFLLPANFKHLKSLLTSTIHYCEAVASEVREEFIRSSYTPWIWCISYQGFGYCKPLPNVSRSSWINTVKERQLLAFETSWPAIYSRRFRELVLATGPTLGGQLTDASSDMTSRLEEKSSPEILPETVIVAIMDIVLSNFSSCHAKFYCNTKPTRSIVPSSTISHFITRNFMVT